MKRSAIWPGGTIPVATTPEEGSASSGESRSRQSRRARPCSRRRAPEALGKPLAHQRQRVEQMEEPLFLGEAAQEEQHRTAADAVARADLRFGLAGVGRLGDRRENPPDLVDPVGQRRRVPRIVFGVRHGSLGAVESEVLRRPSGDLHQPLDQAGRRLQVAVVRHDQRHPVGRGQSGKGHGVDERKVEVQEVAAPDLGGRSGKDRRGDQGLAEPRQDRHANDPHAVLSSFDGELGRCRCVSTETSWPRGGESLRQMLHVQRQPRNVGAVVVQGHQKLHGRGRTTA